MLGSGEVMRANMPLQLCMHICGTLDCLTTCYCGPAPLNCVTETFCTISIDHTHLISIYRQENMLISWTGSINM
jgi:hypothetical protein